MPLNPGDVFAGYTIVRQLGSGGMGEVYLAQHPRLPRRDALKVLPAALTADQEYRQRFSREADLASELWHPHIVGIHDRGEFEGQLWLSMDYVDGTDAAKLLRSRYPSGMPKTEAFAVISAIADALDYAHHRGLLHRDIKPANILLSDTEQRGRRILLADFGIARQVGDISGLTATNMVLGTTAYAAPEQLMGKAIDGRADQYALGCTAFHLLTGAAPYDDPNAAVVISQHLSAPTPSVGDRRPELAGVNAVISKAMAKDPAARFASCSDFAAELTGQSSSATLPVSAPAGATTRLRGTDAPAIHGVAPQQSTPRKAPQRALRPVVAIAAIATVVLLAVAVVVGGQLLRRHGTEPSNGVPSAAIQPGSDAIPTSASPTAAAPSVQLARYITDRSGVLTEGARAEVERVISKLFTERNVHLWVVYDRGFSGLTPFRWAEDAMRANGFTDMDALLAINTEERHFAFRVPDAVTSGTTIDVAVIRRSHIEPAVRRGEWARAAVAAANGLDGAAE